MRHFYKGAFWRQRKYNPGKRNIRNNQKFRITLQRIFREINFNCNFLIWLFFFQCPIKVSKTIQ